MITPEDIKAQLMLELPKHSDVFSTVISAETGTVSAGVTTIGISKEAHGYASNDIIHVTGAEVILPINFIDYTESSNTIAIRLISPNAHDRTSGEDAGEYNFATIQNADRPEFDGTYNIISADSGQELVLDAGEGYVPPLSGGGTAELVEARSLILGLAVVTKVDEDNFTIPLNDTLVDETEFQTFNYVAEQNILITADINRATSFYAQRRNPPPILFIIMGEESISKDRNVTTDAATADTPQNPIQHLYMQEFTLLALFDTKKQHSAATQQQEVYEDIKPALRRTLYGHIFEQTETSVVFAAAEISNHPVRFNTNNYAHAFVYQLPYKISYLQGDDFRRNVSFRDVIVNSTMFNNEGALLSLEVEPEI